MSKKIIKINPKALKRAQLVADNPNCAHSIIAAYLGGVKDYPIVAPHSARS